MGWSNLLDLLDILELILELIAALVEKLTAKAQVVAYHLKSLANTNRGPLSSAVRRAVRACVDR